MCHPVDGLHWHVGMLADGNNAAQHSGGPCPEAVAA
jgi:hypothetical protein